MRGYRENLLVRDNGVQGSLEARIPIPLPRLGDWRPGLGLGAFIDVGRAWNVRRRFGDRDLLSVGIAATLRPTASTQIDLVFGEPLIDVDVPGERSLQDRGVFLAFSCAY